MKKYIYLDLDGVLNAPGDIDLDYDFSIKRLHILEKIIFETKAHIVIISSRKFYEYERIEIDKIFKKYLIYDYSYMDSSTDFLGRPNQVLNHKKRNKIKKFVIIDDNDYGYAKIKSLKKHFEFINDYNGLTDIRYLNILKRLK